MVIQGERDKGFGISQSIFLLFQNLTICLNLADPKPALLPVRVVGQALAVRPCSAVPLGIPHGSQEAEQGSLASMES